jgi:hypothetical protein
MIQTTTVLKSFQKIPFTEVYALKTRQTYLGIHREILRPDVEVGCSKATLMGFTKKRDALRFRDLLVEQQKKRKILNRELREDGCLEFVSQDTYSVSLSPIEIESIPRLFILYMCLLHSMDLWVVDDFSRTEGSYPVQWKLYAYESRTDSRPTPDILSQMI